MEPEADPQRPDWRHGFQEQESEWVKQLEDWKERRVQKSFELSNGKSKFPYEMSEDELREVARELARRGVERAINEFNSREIENRRRHRLGMGN